jgi:hypothetical protein
VLFSLLLEVKVVDGLMLAEIFKWMLLHGWRHFTAREGTGSVVRTGRLTAEAVRTLQVLLLHGD